MPLRCVSSLLFSTSLLVHFRNHSGETKWILIEVELIDVEQQMIFLNLLQRGNKRRGDGLYDDSGELAEAGNAMLPSRTITVLTVCVPATRSYIFWELRVRLQRRVHGYAQGMVEV